MSGKTIEQQLFGVSWKTCSACGLTGPDMIGNPPRCAIKARCDAVKKGQGFGGKPLPETPRAPTHDLDDEDRKAIAAAIAKHGPEIRRRIREAQGVADDVVSDAPITNKKTNGVHK